MFELPECATLARQMNETLPGKTIEQGRLGNRPHKFVWYNLSHEAFDAQTRGLVVGGAVAMGKWITLELQPGRVLLMGECGGKLLYHPAGSDLPSKYHLLVTFEDGSALSATTRMWGAYELHREGEERDRQYIKGMRTTPDDPAFTMDYFDDLLAEVMVMGKRSVKGLLTQDQLIPGLGNAIAQDILFRSKLHPRRDLAELTAKEKDGLYKTIVETVAEITQKGGRNDEFDLFGQPGGYTRAMDAGALKRPCPRCGGEIKKIQYLGGACYLCPTCQPDPRRQTVVKSSSG